MAQSMETTTHEQPGQFLVYWDNSTKHSRVLIGTLDQVIPQVRDFFRNANFKSALIVNAQVIPWILVARVTPMDVQTINRPLERTDLVESKINEASPIGKIKGPISRIDRRHLTPEIERRVKSKMQFGTDHISKLAKGVNTRRSKYKNDPTQHGSGHSRRRISDMEKGIKPKKRLTLRDHTHRLDIGSDLKNCLIFLRDNMNKSGPELKRLLEEFPHKKQLFQLIDHMIATNLGGWRKQGAKLVNESGHEASEENWVLLDDGKLRAINSSKSPLVNMDKLWEWRNYTSE